MNHNRGRSQGIGFSQAHHGELLQGIFRDDKGQLTRALVTLQHPEIGSYARFYADPQKTDISCPPGMSKSYRAAVFSMTHFSTKSSPVIGGRLEVSSTVPHGIGMGSSTADVTATIRAIADFHCVTPSVAEIGMLAVRAECASDSLMIGDRVVLFAQREGVVLETFGPALPRMIVVGCDTDPAVDGIDTVTLTPADYSTGDIEIFGILRAEIRVAMTTGDVARLGRVATSSAMINQQFLPKPTLQFLLEICRCCGGCGVQIAHSGTVAGIIFDSQRPSVTEDIVRCVNYLDKAGLPLTGIISTGLAMPTAPVSGQRDRALEHRHASCSDTTAARLSHALRDRLVTST